MCFAIGCPGHFPCWIQETTALRDKIVRRRQELATLDAEHLRLNHQSDHLFMHGTQARYQREHGSLRSASRGLWAERSMRPGRDQGKNDRLVCRDYRQYVGLATDWGGAMLSQEARPAITHRRRRGGVRIFRP